ncbi:hypothetical protein ACQ27_gp403 [Klebsiella phage K64-1]|nr:hypothetical protein ACQ27_gp403 [Klebsiella phage K64-1]
MFSHRKCEEAEFICPCVSGLTFE